MYMYTFQLPPYISHHIVTISMFPNPTPLINRAARLLNHKCFIMASKAVNYSEKNKKCWGIDEFLR